MHPTHPQSKPQGRKGRKEKGNIGLRISDVGLKKISEKSCGRSTIYLKLAISPLGELAISNYLLAKS